MQPISRRAAIALFCSSTLAGCGALPRSGPLATQISTAETPEDLEGLVAPLTIATAQRVNLPAYRAFPEIFATARRIDPDRLLIDDELDIHVWENASVRLLGGESGPAALPSVRVEPDGSIFLPFAGRIRAEGASPATLRSRIRAAFAPLTLDPQIDVRVTRPAGRMVTVQGAVRAPGSYPLERSALTLTPMLARAGGVTLPAEQTEVFVRREREIGSAMLEDIYLDPALDIALRPGDQIVASPLRSRFVVLGATSAQAEIIFPTRRLSLLSALGAARGLRDFDADPTGVFVFRQEDRALADEILPGPPPPELPVGALRPVVYRLDLTQPESLFVAKAFDMRDGDAVFATNAPLTELRKFLQIFTSVLTPIQQGATITP